MALIKRFERMETDVKAAHPSEVVGYFGTLKEGGRALLQINTYGSMDRQDRGKLSQTVQLTPESAKELYDILGREFGFSN